MRFSRPCDVVAALSVGAAIGVFGSTAVGSIWIEVPDAPRTAPGQLTSGFGPLTEIRGELTGGLRGIQTDYEDVFCIRIIDPAAFSVTTIGGAAFDTQLWLFDANGNGLVFNDNAATDAGVVNQSRISNEQLQWFSQPGFYTLAISGYNTDAASGVNTPIWLDSPRDTQRAPDGPGAGAPLAAWNPGNVLGDDFGVYRIFLTGCEFCIPSPSALAVLLGGAAWSGRRRRRERA